MRSFRKVGMVVSGGARARGRRPLAWHRRLARGEDHGQDARATRPGEKHGQGAHATPKPTALKTLELRRGM